MISKKQFGKYYDEYVDNIYNFIYYRVSLDKQLAYDMTQDVFLKALNKLESYHNTKSSFKTWIYTIAHNLIKDYYKSKNTNLDIDDLIDHIYYTDDMGEKIDQKDKVKEILSSIDKLNGTQKEIILLRVFEELPFKEIAIILDMTEGACKMSYKRSIDTIKGSILQILILIMMI